MRRRLLVLGGIATLTLIILGFVSLPPIRSDGPPAEWRRATASDSVPQSVAEAEEHGARYPRSSGPVAFPKRLAAEQDTGIAERRCVEVGPANVVRAGDMMASPFALYGSDWHRGIHPPGKISWFGAHARSGVPAQL